MLHAELVAKNVYEFKGDVLARQIVLLFVAAIGDSSKHMLGPESIDNGSICWSESDLSQISFNAMDDRLFLAGFGNKSSDSKAYELAGTDRRDIYIINKDSQIKCLECDDTISRRSIDLSLNASTATLPELCCGELSRQNSTELDVVDLPEKSTNKAEFSSTTREQQSINSSRSVRKSKSSKQSAPFQ